MLWLTRNRPVYYYSYLCKTGSACSRGQVLVQLDNSVLKQNMHRQKAS
jgi:hypothetical protein